jgi:hypothetical protein
LVVDVSVFAEGKYDGMYSSANCVVIVKSATMDSCHVKTHVDRGLRKKHAVW